MKEIQLTQGKVAFIDDEDFEIVNKFNWFARKRKTKYGFDFYAGRQINTSKGQRTLNMHRFILSLLDSKIHVDHIDNNGLNNQKNNLRIANNKQNCCNKKVSGIGTSKYKGVTVRKRDGKFVASIKVNYKNKHIGCYNSEIIAALAYNNAAVYYFGEFAKTNIIE